MKISCIKETCIYVKDLFSTKQFYHEKIGLPLISLVEGRHVFFKAGTSVLLCFIAEKTLTENELPPHGTSGMIHFAFEVEKPDYDNAIKTIEAAAITITHQHVWPNGTRSFYFSDPDDNVVEILEKGLWDE